MANEETTNQEQHKQNNPQSVEQIIVKYQKEISIALGVIAVAVLA